MGLLCASTELTLHLQLLPVGGSQETMRIGGVMPVWRMMEIHRG